MGTVYQGRDPTINRIVAIKTIALSAEFDSDELAAARERFFREAESAGRLNHPDIVTVYDAGEEHDVAYIAMEFLTGTHLNPYTRPGHLLRSAQVLTLGARVADALEFAHDQRVVHRDIKPANVMYNPKTGDIKITDFGIARITDSSRTRTGAVLGHAVLHGARTAVREKRDRALGHIFPGCYAVSAADRRIAIPGRFPGGPDVQDRQRRLRAPRRPAPGPSGLRRGDAGSGARERIRIGATAPAANWRRLCESAGPI